MFTLVLEPLQLSDERRGLVLEGFLHTHFVERAFSAEQLVIVVIQAHERDALGERPRRPDHGQRFFVDQTIAEKGLWHRSPPVIGRAAGMA